MGHDHQSSWRSLPFPCFHPGREGDLAQAGEPSDKGFHSMSFPLSFSWYFKFDGPPQVFI
jgi:hypothetical protein